ncbi:MAG TPA: SCP2 sterol-binding domain-containing protein [Pseudonocardia sp.]|jgi:putative sterol carrier protein|uniref:SCP2 sterol-binding domain-containing protein n=1 Tax=Pseudonocardia sp. TaxID=60912 RepID=UPI002F41FF74
MPGFASEDELYRYVGGIFETGFGDPDLGPRMAATQMIFQLKCTEPDSSLIIDMSSRKVYQGTDGPEPDAVLLMSTEMSNAHWQGKVNLPVAMARGKVKVEGNAAKLLALAPLGKKLFPRYVESLKADGRDDLVI